jgi:hypothetical protein
MQCLYFIVLTYAYALITPIALNFPATKLWNHKNVCHIEEYTAVLWIYFI